MDRKALIYLSLTLVLIPFLAQGIEFPNPFEYDTIQELVDDIINLIFILSWILAPLMIIIGAFYIMSSGGDPSRRQTGIKIIQYALIGAGMILGAKLIVWFIREFLSGA